MTRWHRMGLAAADWEVRAWPFESAAEVGHSGEERAGYGVVR